MASFFDMPYNSDMDKIVSKVNIESNNNASLYLIQSYEIDKIVLLDNDANSTNIILGVSAPQESDDETLKLQAFYNISKNSIEINKFWPLNFTINDKNAT